MTTPITTQKHTAVPVASPLARRDWCCGTTITEPHVPGCPSAPSEDNLVDYAAVADVQSAEPEPPPTPPTEGAAAASRRSYGFTKREEGDLELPSGALVRYRKLNPGTLLKLNLVEVMDGFTRELLADIQSGDDAKVNAATVKALSDPENNAKIFGPVDRIVAAAVLIPTVVLEGPTTDTQVNIDDVDLEDKMTIFSAALGEQLDALKSVRSEPPSGL